MKYSKGLIQTQTFAISKQVMVKKLVQSFDQVSIFKYFIKWLVLVLPVALVVGSLVALFLWLLDVATQTRWQN
ncbi:MAG: hypothetical protein Q8909_18745, partial [Bacteroidota bacterium]|nr:hypothetical protein [Bacteroidota bacterium]